MAAAGGNVVGQLGNVALLAVAVAEAEAWRAVNKRGLLCGSGGSEWHVLNDRSEGDQTEAGVR